MLENDKIEKTCTTLTKVASRILNRYVGGNVLACEWQKFLLAYRRCGTFREEERLRLSDRNSILTT